MRDIHQKQGLTENADLDSHRQSLNIQYGSDQGAISVDSGDEQDRLRREQLRFCEAG